MTAANTTALAITELRAALGADALLTDVAQLNVYECDGFTIPRAAPDAVAFPRDTPQVSQAVRILLKHKIPMIPRGAGTGLAGGTAAVSGGVVICTSRMKTIHAVDLRNRWALVDAGVANLALSDKIKGSGLHFAPDPSSQRASTIGGNAATNAGGIHTLKHGVTVHHILGLEVVLEDGSVHVLGGPMGHAAGPDFAGLFCGSEGTLGIVTRVWCRLVRRPAAFRTALAVFDDSQDACHTVGDIIAAGIVPAALEMMDGTMIRVVEEAFGFGFPAAAQALLLLEIDGIEAGLNEDLTEIQRIAKAHNARSFEGGSDARRRAELWSARKKAFGAIGRISPNYCTQDACVPRGRLPEVIARIAEICVSHKLRITNVFHAGDGNVHPVLMYDEADVAQTRSVLAASGEILRYCVGIGGTVSGEHGVGIEKMPYMRDMFSPDDLEAMHRIRRALVPLDLLNPYKVLPRDGVEIDLLSPRRHVPQ